MKNGKVYNEEYDDYETVVLYATYDLEQLNSFGGGAMIAALL